MLLLISLGIALVAFFVAKNIEPTHEVHFSYLVSLSQREEAAEFRFDGFYALQATDLFAATLANWITTPEVLVASYERAGVSLLTHNPRQLTRSVEAVKSAPQLVHVVVKAPSAMQAERVASGMRSVMEENIARYHDQGIPELTFRAVATEPWTGVSHISVPIIVISTFVFVFFIGLNGVLLMQSLRMPNAK